MCLILSTRAIVRITIAATIVVIDRSHAVPTLQMTAVDIVAKFSTRS